MSQPFPHPGTPYVPPGASSYALQRSNDSSASLASPPPLPPPKMSAIGSHSQHSSLSGTPVHQHYPSQEGTPFDPDRRYNQPPPPPPPPPPHPSQQQYEGQHPQQQAQYQQDDELYSQPLPRHDGQDQQAEQHPFQQIQSANTQHQLPPEGWLPDSLSERSRQELEVLLADPKLLAALVHAPSTSHPALKASTTALQQRLAANMTLAASLEALEQTLEQRRAAAQQHLLAVRALEQQWRKKQLELDARLEAFGPRVLHQRLGQGIAEQEHVCAGLEESFLEAAADRPAEERDVADWVRRVREARRVATLRRERRARWDEGRVGGWR